MKKRHLLAAAAIALSIPFGTAFAAGATPQGKTQAQVVGPVRITGPGQAEVTARYICQPEFNHLWVSAKQVADRHPDQRLQGEGSSDIAAGWEQSHPANFTCDGAWHTDSFTISGAEYQTDLPLAQGQAWVQFCLTAETGPDSPPAGLVMYKSWAAVR